VVMGKRKFTCGVDGELCKSIAKPNDDRKFKYQPMEPKINPITNAFRTYLRKKLEKLIRLKKVIQLSKNKK